MVEENITASLRKQKPENMSRIYAICKKTYPDENDMIAFAEGDMEACDVKIYYKGKKYEVSKYADPEYYEFIQETKPVKT